MGGHLRVQAGHARLRPVAPDRRHDLRSAAAVRNGPSAIAGGIRRNDSKTAVPPQGQSRIEEPHLAPSRLEESHLVQSHLRSTERAAGRGTCPRTSLRVIVPSMSDTTICGTRRAGYVRRAPARMGCAQRTLAEKRHGPRRAAAARAHKHTRTNLDREKRGGWQDGEGTGVGRGKKREGEGEGRCAPREGGEGRGRGVMPLPASRAATSWPRARRACARRRSAPCSRLSPIPSVGTAERFAARG